jgi:hypothetical protein
MKGKVEERREGVVGGLGKSSDVWNLKGIGRG